jgi:FkbM family methyltransferase
MFVKRIAVLLRRRRAAAAFKIRFKRGKTFSIPDKIFLNGRQVRLSLPDEKGIKVAFVELLLDDCYGCNVFKKLGEKIETVLDIGGNVGLFGIAARNTFPRATIHSYEPNRKLESYLAVQARAAKFDFFMEAIGLADGVISLDSSEESVLTRSRQDSDGAIPQTAFSKAIDRMNGTVDLLKMDCEGAEWEIFKDKESWKKINNLSLEYHLFDAEHTQEAVKQIIENLGFTILSLVQTENFGLVHASRMTRL